MKLSLAGLVLALLFGCSNDNDDGDDTTKPPPKETDCSNEQFIDATSMDAWIYYDLESMQIVSPANPDDSTEWDLAFQRFKVKSNGGISGTGGVEVAEVESAVCNDLLEAPSTGYLTDVGDSDDEGDIPDYAMSFGPSSETGPWGYEPMMHQLFQSGSVFVVKSVEGNYFKLDFFEYYGPSGTAAELTFNYKTVKAPTVVLPPGVIEVATTLQGYTHLDFEDGVITVADPATSTDWDVAVSGPAWRTNGGLERAGVGGARIASSTDFDAITMAPTIGYRVDADIPYPGPPGSGNYVGNPVLVNWFVYNSTDHTVEPKDEVYLIRGGDGTYGKLRILDYDEMTLTYHVKLEPVAKTVEVASTSIDAAGDDFTYYSLRLGEVLDIDDAAASTEWDLGLSRTRLRTNGGTSGPGRGGAAGPIAMPFDMITAVPGEFTADAMIEDPENPGSQYSGNAVLAQWFDGTSTSTTPSDVAFVVRTADGGFSKIKITGWADGTFTVDHAYAGAGEEAF
jgi:hypothetical protein